MSVNKSKINKQKEVKKCSKCVTDKDLKEYYLASSTLIHSDGKLGICKDCLESITNFNDPYAVLNVMRMIDRPFLKPEYDASIEQTKKSPFREYMRRLGMPQNKELNFTHSKLETLDVKVIKESDLNISQNSREEKEITNINVTREMVIKWGETYSDIEILQLEKFWTDMVRANDIQTPQHKAQLELLCKVYLEQNKALSEKRFGDFKNLNGQYNQILRDSGFRPIDRQTGGESSGIRTFSQIWEEIERDGFIKPADITENQDIVDKTIMYMSNYTRKLLNMHSLAEPPSDTPKVSDEE